MLLYLLLMLTIVPAVELWLIVRAGQGLGIGPTLAVILVTGVLGSWLAKHQGLSVWQRVHAALAAGRVPARDLLEGVFVLFAGALLLTPGFLTDGLGFLLLVPWVRRRLIDQAVRRISGRGRGNARAASAAAPSDVIDVHACTTVAEHDEDRARRS